MATMLITKDGKRMKISDDDPCLFKSPMNPPNTGTRYTTGSDLYAHTTKNGNVYFYLYNWSMWQGSEASYEIISKDEAEEFVIMKMGSFYGPSSEELDFCKRFRLNIDEETA